tara:strand:+ start:1101 stop:1394 length:294 start_codon:yes stop_codon:yes gene_type:complete
MAITKTWKVETMERDISDGYVNTVIYSVKGVDGSDEKGSFSGEVSFIKPSSLPSDFVAYDSLNETTVLGWVKTIIGTEQVATIEKNVETSTAFAKPF